MGAGVLFLLWYTEDIPDSNFICDSTLVYDSDNSKYTVPTVNIRALASAVASYFFAFACSQRRAPFFWTVF